MHSIHACLTQAVSWEKRLGLLSDKNTHTQRTPPIPAINLNALVSHMVNQTRGGTTLPHRTFAGRAHRPSRHPIYRGSTDAGATGSTRCTVRPQAAPLFLQRPRYYTQRPSPPKTASGVLVHSAPCLGHRNQQARPHVRHRTPPSRNPQR